MTRRSRRSTLLVPVLAGLLTLAACNHGEGGNQSGSAQSPQSHSGSHEAAQSIPMSGEYPILPNGKLGRPVDWVEPHEPQLPSAATNMDAFGARYFAEYYLNLLAYSINTGNTTTLKKVSSPDCKVCQSFISRIDRQYAADGWNEGLEYQIKYLNDAIPHPTEPNLFYVEAWIYAPSYIALTEKGLLGQAKEASERLEIEVRSTPNEFVLNRLYAENDLSEKQS